MADTYVSITFVADELLTSTKMNQLAANQANFHNGTALGDGIIVTRHLAGVSNLKIPVNIKELASVSSPNVRIQAGWDYASSVAGQSLATKAVTFPVPFTRILALIVSPVGTAPAGSSPTSIDDLTANYSGGYIQSNISPSKTGFTAKIALSTGTFGGNNERWGFSWIAIGT